jgi:hypothetical protein
MTTTIDIRIMASEVSPGKWQANAYEHNAPKPILKLRDSRGLGASRNQAIAHMLEQIAQDLKTKS